MSFIVILINMEERYSWSWVEVKACGAIEAWNRYALRTLPPIPRFTPREQHKRERPVTKACAASSARPGGFHVPKPNAILRGSASSEHSLTSRQSRWV